MVRTGNLRDGVPSRTLPEEVIEHSAQAERSPHRAHHVDGQVTAEGDWYDQDSDEWVLLVSGQARLRIEGEAEDRELAEGDWILLPAHCRHRVTWTRAAPPTLWIAVHVAPSGDPL